MVIKYVVLKAPMHVRPHLILHTGYGRYIYQALLPVRLACAGGLGGVLDAAIDLCWRDESEVHQVRTSAGDLAGVDGVNPELGDNQRGGWTEVQSAKYLRVKARPCLLQIHGRRTRMLLYEGVQLL